MLESTPKSIQLRKKGLIMVAKKVVIINVRLYLLLQQSFLAELLPILDMMQKLYIFQLLVFPHTDG